jgi:microcystin-dependent protein
MSCESCYNGCVQTVSDECVRYTGINYAALGVETGDNLVSVEQAIMNALVPLLSGRGDAIALNISCPIVDEFLPDHTPNTQELFTATVSAICSLQTQVFTIDDILAVLNADYGIGCLTGVTSSSDTHAIVQAIINKLCAVAADLTALTLDVNTNYVKLADLDALIAAYIASQSGGGSNQQYLKMVPYVAYEYYGSLTNFDGTGAGLNSAGFYKVYLCNGLNGTPDRRGRVGVGAIQNVPGGPLDAAVNPANPGNPNYAIFNTAGANTITLITSQLPSHSHAAVGTTTVTLNDPGHFHFAGRKNAGGLTSSGSIGLAREAPQDNQSTTSTTGITVTSNTANNVAIGVSNTGSGAAHPNIQPVIAAYYIMYIP